MFEAFHEQYYMNLAYEQAVIAFEKGEVPVGAVVVCNGQVIAKAHNQTELLTDVTAHAEILAITAASQFLGAKYLPNCTLYVTLEPCTMCAGALYWSQIGEIIYGAQDTKRGYGNLNPDPLHPKTKVKYGIMQNEIEQLMKDFFRNLRT